MKKRLLVFLLAVSLTLLAVTVPVAALELLIGPRFSLGHAFDYGGGYRDYLESTDARRQLNIKTSLGAFAEITLLPLLALQPELMYTRGGYRDYNESFTEYRSVQNYIEALLLVKLIVPAGRASLQVFAGPDLRYGVGTWEYDVDDVTMYEYDREARKAADIRNTYLGVVAGAGIRLQRGYNTLMLDARGYLGLQNSDSTDTVKRKPAALWLNMGYGFSLEKRDRSRKPVRFKKVSGREMLVARSEDIPDNPFFSAYLASGYLERRLYAHAVRMDLGLGLRRDTGFAPSGMEVVIFKPVEIRSGHKHPADGVWMHRFSLSREGKTRTYNLWFIAQKRQEPRYVPGIMGTTRTDMELQYDLVQKVYSAARARLKNPANRTIKAFIYDSRVLDSGQAAKDAWREEWTVLIGSEAVPVEIDFSAGPLGIINFTLVSE